LCDEIWIVDEMEMEIWIADEIWIVDELTIWIVDETKIYQNQKGLASMTRAPLL
jgi:hypothetical protein